MHAPRHPCEWQRRFITSSSRRRRVLEAVRSSCMGFGREIVIGAAAGSESASTVYSRPKASRVIVLEVVHGWNCPGFSYRQGGARGDILR